jgi:AAA domain-containing protein
MAEKLSSEEIKKCIEQAEATARSANVNPAKRGADGARSRVDSAHVGAELIVQCAADITPEPVEWLWPGRVALGKLALIGGEPGLGKSQVAIEIVTAVTTGGELPCGEGRAPQGNVVILSAEDGVADTIVPRLMATGADRNRVHIISAVKDQAGRRGFNLSADLELLEQEIASFGDVRLVVIDPISSYLGSKVDSHVNAAVRSVLEPVSEMAARLRIAFVAITHQPKGTGTAAIHRFIGSIAFVAAARSAYLVISDPEDKDRRLFLPVKNNLAPLGQGLAFRLDQRLVGDPDRAIVASSVVWESEPVAISADQALQANDAQVGGQVSPGVEAEDFLVDLLGSNSVPVADIKRDAAAAGIAWTTVRRAKNRLKVIVERKSHGFGGKGEWLWRLPDAHKMLIPSTRCSSQEMSTLCRDEHLVDQEGAHGRIFDSPADDPDAEFVRESPPPPNGHYGGNGTYVRGGPGLDLREIEALARDYKERADAQRRGGCEVDQEKLDAWVRQELAKLVLSEHIETELDRVMEAAFGAACGHLEDPR